MTKTKWHYGQKTDYNYVKICCQNQHTAVCVCVCRPPLSTFLSPETLSPPPRGASLQETSALEQICPHTERYKHRHMAHVSTERGWGWGDTPESNINKNHVNAEALAMRTADSAQPCLITVHLGQRPNGRLGCRPRQTTFHLASTARKSWVWLMRAYWSRRSTNG